VRSPPSCTAAQADRASRECRVDCFGLCGHRTHMPRRAGACGCSETNASHAPAYASTERVRCDGERCERGRRAGVRGDLRAVRARDGRQLRGRTAGARADDRTHRGGVAYARVDRARKTMTASSATRTAGRTRSERPIASRARSASTSSRAGDAPARVARCTRRCSSGSRRAATGWRSRV
jgi:hypothetical protein